MNSSPAMDGARRTSGAWTPLFAAQPVARDVLMALKSLVAALNAAMPYMQTCEDGVGPDCTKQFQALIDGHAAIAAAEQAQQAAGASVNVENRTLELGPGLCVEGSPDGKMKVTCQFPHAPTWLPDAMTPDMMRAVQMRSELGAYAAANLAGAYDLFAEFWRVAVEEVKKGGAKC